MTLNHKKPYPRGVVITATKSDNIQILILICV